MTMTTDYKEKLSHINDLIKLSQADSHEDISEVKFINRVAERLGVEADDVENIRLGKMVVTFTPPKEEFKRIADFHRLILLMGIDYNLDDTERQFCFDIGFRMGINFFAIQEILDKMKITPGYVLPPEEIQKIFRKFNN
jgi:hypothetical protein